MHIHANTIGIPDGLKFAAEDGAKPVACCLRSQSLRTGAMAFGGVSIPTFFFAMDRPVLISWIPVESVIHTGILLQGLAVEKFIETSDGQQVWKKDCKSAVLMPGQSLYLPFGTWPRINFYNPPVKGYPIY